MRGRNPCQVSVVSRWHLFSRWHLAQIYLSLCVCLSVPFLLRYWVKSPRCSQVLSSKLISYLVGLLMLEIGPHKTFVCTEQPKQRIIADISYVHSASYVQTRHP